jgi:hypothetical protein
MSNFKTYGEWLNEASEYTLKAREKAPEFIENVKKALAEAGFEYTITSSPIQIKNGTLNLNGLRNSTFLSEKSEELGLSAISKSYEDVKRSAGEVELPSMIVYSRGVIKETKAPNNGFEFSPTPEGIKTYCIEWLKRNLLRRFLNTVHSHLKYETFKVNSSYKGYKLSEKTLDLIETELGEILRVREYRTNWTSQFESISLESALKKIDPRIAEAFSPFLVLSYFIHKAGMNLLHTDLIISGKTSRTLTVDFKLHGDDRLQRINVYVEDKMKISRNLDKVETYINMEVFASALKMKSYADIGKQLPAIADFLEIAKKSSNAEDLDKFAEERRGMISGKKFGF